MIEWIAMSIIVIFVSLLILDGIFAIMSFASWLTNDVIDD